MAQITPTMPPHRRVMRPASFPQEHRSRLGRIARGSADIGRVLALGILAPQDLIAEERSWSATTLRRDR